MGDSSPIEAKSIRVAQASEGEPSLPESQRGEEKQEKDKSVEKEKKERGKDHWVPRGRDARTYLKKAASYSSQANTPAISPKTTSSILPQTTVKRNNEGFASQSPRKTARRFLLVTPDFMKVNLQVYECPKCGKNVVMRERKGTIDEYEWRCRTKGGENPHDSMNEFAVKDVRVNKNTVVDWYMFCREVCMAAVLKESEPHSVVKEKLLKLIENFSVRSPHCTLPWRKTFLQLNHYCAACATKHPLQKSKTVISGKGSWTGRLYVVKDMMWQDQYKDALQNRLIPQLEE
ncbi:hypothetical protein TNCV_3826761 [Trichonephila clavipes]|nr:hypothetical protein TNCV_3826761 [Trichonephila clavipes]